MDAAFLMTNQRFYLFLLLLILGIPSSVHAGCDIFSAKLERIKAEEKQSYKKARKEYVKRKCGSESQSWIGGAAGRRRFKYLNCKLMARSSEQFKKEWAMRVVKWQSKRQTVENELLSYGCAE